MAFCQLITAAVSVTSSTEVKTATTASMNPRSLLTLQQESDVNTLAFRIVPVLGFNIGLYCLQVTRLLDVPSSGKAEADHPSLAVKLRRPESTLQRVTLVSLRREIDLTA